MQGLGGYAVRRNSLISAVDLGQDPPAVANTNRGEATVINHREYIGDLYSGINNPSQFKLQTFSLNPGNKDLFPFLADIAKNFQEYEIRGMLVELKSLSSEYAADLAMGSYFMAADYNVYGSNPTTKQQVENMEYSSSAKPSRSMIMPIECDPANNMMIHKNICINQNYDGGDKRLYDWCNIYIGSQGVPQAESTLAEIWLTYEIALFKPILNQNEPDPPEEDWGFLQYQFSGIATDYPFGTALERAGWTEEDPQLILTYAGVPPNEKKTVVLFFPQMNQNDTTVFYLVNYLITLNAAMTVYTPVVTTFSNCSAQEIWPISGISGASDTGFVEEDDKVNITWMVKVPPPDGTEPTSPSITFASGIVTTTATETAGIFTVTAVNPILYPNPS